MSGFLAVTLREPDGTEHRLLGWNTVAPSFMRAGIPEGRPEAIAHVLGSWTRMRADFDENGPDGPFRYRNADWFAPPGLLAPEEYGLLVVDLAERVILDGQEGHPLDEVPLYRAIGESEAGFTCRVDSDTHRFFELYRAGRVGRLYLPTAGSTVKLPPGEPEKTLRFLAASRKLLSLETHLRSWFSLDIAPLRLERFDYTSRKEDGMPEAPADPGAVAHDPLQPPDVPMKNLKPDPKRREALCYRDREEGDIIEVEVYYSRGMAASTRGVFLAIRPAHIAPDGTYSCVLLAGRSTRVRPLARSTPSVLNSIAAAADEKVVELAAAYRADRAAGGAAFDLLAAELRAA